MYIYIFFCFFLRGSHCTLASDYTLFVSVSMLNPWFSSDYSLFVSVGMLKSMIFSELWDWSLVAFLRRLVMTFLGFNLLELLTFNLLVNCSGHRNINDGWMIQLQMQLSMRHVLTSRNLASVLWVHVFHDFIRFICSFKPCVF